MTIKTAEVPIIQDHTAHRDCNKTQKILEDTRFKKKETGHAPQPSSSDEAAGGMDGADSLQLLQATAEVRAASKSGDVASPNFYICDILLPQVVAT